MARPGKSQFCLFSFIPPLLLLPCFNPALTGPKTFSVFAAASCSIGIGSLRDKSGAFGLGLSGRLDLLVGQKVQVGEIKRDAHRRIVPRGNSMELHGTCIISKLPCIFRHILLVEACRFQLLSSPAFLESSWALSCWRRRPCIFSTFTLRSVKNLFFLSCNFPFSFCDGLEL